MEYWGLELLCVYSSGFIAGTFFLVCGYVFLIILFEDNFRSTGQKLGGSNKEWPQHMRDFWCDVNTWHSIATDIFNSWIWKCGIKDDFLLVMDLILCLSEWQYYYFPQQIHNCLSPEASPTLVIIIYSNFYQSDEKSAFTFILIISILNTFY